MHSRHRAPPGLGVPAPCPYPRGEGGAALPPPPAMTVAGNTRGGKPGRRPHRIQPLGAAGGVGAGGESLSARGDNMTGADPGHHARQSALSAPASTGADLGLGGAPVPRATRRAMGKGSAGTSFTATSAKAAPRPPMVPSHASSSPSTASSSASQPNSAVAAVEMVVRLLSDPDMAAALRSRDDFVEATTRFAGGANNAATSAGGGSFDGVFGLVMAIPLRFDGSEEDADAMAADIVAAVRGAGAKVVATSFDRVVCVFPVATEAQPDALEAADAMAAGHAASIALIRRGDSPVKAVGLSVGRVDCIEGPSPYAGGAALRDAVRASAARLQGDGACAIFATERCSNVLGAVGVVAVAQTDVDGVVGITEFDPQGDREDTL